MIESTWSLSEPFSWFKMSVTSSGTGSTESPASLALKSASDCASARAGGDLPQLWGEFLQHVLYAVHQPGAFLQKTIAAARASGQGAAGHGEDLAVLLERHAGGDQRAAFLGRLNDYHPKAKPRYKAVAGGEVLG